MGIVGTTFNYNQSLCVLFFTNSPKTHHSQPMPSSLTERSFHLSPTGRDIYTKPRLQRNELEKLSWAKQPQVKEQVFPGIRNLEMEEEVSSFPWRELAPGSPVTLCWRLSQGLAICLRLTYTLNKSVCHRAMFVAVEGFLVQLEICCCIWLLFYRKSETLVSRSLWGPIIEKTIVVLYIAKGRKIY